MKNNFLLLLRLLVSGAVLLLAAAAPALAQPGSGGPAPGAVTSTPIDGGASLLLVAGAGLALKHLRSRRAARRSLS